MGEIGMPIAPGIERILGIVAVNQIDPAGGGENPVDDAIQVLAGGPCMTGIQAETHIEVPDHLPESSYHLDLATHGMLTTGHARRCARGCVDCRISSRSICASCAIWLTRR